MQLHETCIQAASKSRLSRPARSDGDLVRMLPQSSSLNTPAVITANRDGNYIAVRRAEMNDILDSLRRIGTNLDAAAAIFENGARSFRNEASGIESARRIIERFCRL